ncbi:unnamed protein product [Enterobius vermicularis]|uniref:Uncharacterized protein n=1 Tax=Enterobius vermicularis TaxID=51028 RepID=A0A0N4V2J8_ENTVE|nr:unnamed protein product [Enterobius vermicularis]
MVLHRCHLAGTEKRSHETNDPCVRHSDVVGSVGRNPTVRSPVCVKAPDQSDVGGASMIHSFTGFTNLQFLYAFVFLSSR